MQDKVKYKIYIKEKESKMNIIVGLSLASLIKNGAEN